jgi:hypothetical protein
MMPAAKRLSVRGYLIHLTHYDPRWYQRKRREKPFDLELSLEIVEALAREKFNVLVIDCADGVKYKSHPELARHYSAPRKHLETLASAARERGLEVVPKLNFSRSSIHHHNDWLLGPGEPWHRHFDDAAYWKKAFEVIDELIAVCQPSRFFHVGMDEDHDRSYRQYIEAIRTLRAGLRKRKLRTLIWNDTGIEYASGLIHAEKSLAAEPAIPRDIVQVLWRYHGLPGAAIRRLRKQGFELWGAPGASDPAQVTAFRDAVLRAGGKGLLMTRWTPCRPSNRGTLLRSIRLLGPIYRGEA